MRKITQKIYEFNELSEEIIEILSKNEYYANGTIYQ